MPTRNYLEHIKNVLSTGAVLSGDITDALIYKFGIRKNYGRTLLHRYVKNKDIYTSYPLIFKSGQAAYSLNPGNNEYVHLLHLKPRLDVVYKVFLANRFISKYELLKLSGVLNVVNSRYYDIERVINDLKYFFPNLEETLINDEVFYHDGMSEEEYIRVYDQIIDRRLFEQQFYPLILNYCKGINLISSKPRYISSEKPFTGINIRQNLVFDAVAFTNIGNPNEEKTVVVFDIKINEEYTPYDFDGFKYRVDTLINSTKKFNQRVIPVIFTKSMTYSVFNNLYDKNKYLVLSLSNIFGSKITEFMNVMELNDIDGIKEAQEILKTVENTGFAKQLTRFFPYVFEAIISEILNEVLIRKGYTYSIRRGYKPKFNGKFKEYDIWFENDNEILIVECKNYSSKVNWENRDSRNRLKRDCCKYFFEDKLQFLVDNGIVKPVKMVIIASNGFSTGALSNISKLDNTLKHNSLPLSFSGTELIEYCKTSGIGITDQKEWLTKYYIK